MSASWHTVVSGVTNEIGNYRRPVILFGNFPSADNHAIVAYGYNHWENSGAFTFICHYGWDNYSNIHVYAGNSTFGSNTQYNVD